MKINEVIHTSNLNNPFTLHVYNNVLFANESVYYFYEVIPFSNIDKDTHHIEYTIKLFKDMIRKMNMPGGILIVPEVYDTQRNLYSLHSHFDTYGFEELKAVFEEVNEQAKDNFKKKVIKKYYLYFCEGRAPLTKKYNILSHFKDALSKYDYSDVKKILKHASTVEDQLFNQLGNAYSSELVFRCERVDEVISSIDLNALNTSVKIRNHFRTYGFENLTDHFIRDVDSQKLELYSRVVMVKELPASNTGGSNFGVILNNDLAVLTHIKFEPYESKDISRELEQNAFYIEKAHKNFVKHQHYVDHETKRTAVKAKALVQKAIALSDDALINTQILFKISNFNSEKLEKNVHLFDKQLKRSQILIDHMPGRQEDMYLSMFPFINENKQHIQKLNVEYFANLNLLGSNYLGSLDGYFLLKESKTDKPIHFNPLLIREGKTANTSTTFTVVGKSGSGKSMLAYQLALLMMLNSGYRVTWLYPKSDQLNIGVNTTWLQPHTNIIRVGDSDEYNGVLCPFAVYKQDQQLAFEVSYQIVQRLSEALKKQISIADFKVAYQYVKDNAPIQNQVTLLNILRYIAVSDEFTHETNRAAKDLIEIKEYQLGRLFFCDEHTKVFNLNNKFNIIQLFNVPDTTNNTNDIRYILGDLLIEMINEILLNLSNDSNSRDLIIVDEFHVFSKFKTAERTIEKLSRVLRSQDNYLMIVSQAMTDIPKTILQMCSTYFVGVLEGTDEIDVVSNQLQLPNTLKTRLIEKMSASTIGTVSDFRKYDFILKDYNNNTGIVETIPISKEVYDDFNDQKH